MIKEIRFKTRVQDLSYGPCIVEDFLQDFVDQEVSVVVRRIPKKGIAGMLK